MTQSPKKPEYMPVACNGFAMLAPVEYRPHGNVVEFHRVLEKESKK